MSAKLDPARLGRHFAGWVAIFLVISATPYINLAKVHLLSCRFAPSIAQGKFTTASKYQGAYRPSCWPCKPLALSVVMISNTTLAQNAVLKSAELLLEIFDHLSLPMYTLQDAYNLDPVKKFFLVGCGKVHVLPEFQKPALDALWRTMDRFN